MHGGDSFFENSRGGTQGGKQKDPRTKMLTHGRNKVGPKSSTQGAAQKRESKGVAHELDQGGTLLNPPLLNGLKFSF